MWFEFCRRTGFKYQGPNVSVDILDGTIYLRRRGKQALEGSQLAPGRAGIKGAQQPDAKALSTMSHCFPKPQF